MVQPLAVQPGRARAAWEVVLVLRIRSIHYNAFRSSKLARLSAEAERLWWRIQCLCDDDGRSEDDSEVICGFVFPKRRDITPEHVEQWLAEIAAEGLIRRYEANDQRYFAVEQWHEYQHPRRPQTSKIPAPPSEPVATGPSSSRQVAQEGLGVEKEIRGAEGESEGEPLGLVLERQPVDNTSLTGTLREKCERVGARYLSAYEGESA